MEHIWRNARRDAFALELAHVPYYVLPLVIACLLFFAAIPLAAQPADGTAERFAEGNRLYAAGDYEGALSSYLALRESGQRSGELFYNIGNAYYKLGRLGEAILYYERALKYMPQDEDLLTNLQLARLSITDKITPLPELFYQRLWRSLKYAMTFTGWKTAAYIFYILLGVWLSIRVLFRNRIIRKLSKPLIFMLFTAAALSFWISISVSRDLESANTGIILAKEVSVRSSPTEEGTALFSLHEGAKVWIKRRSEGWSEIRIADGKTGWLPQNSYEVI